MVNHIKYILWFVIVWGFLSISSLVYCQTTDPLQKKILAPKEMREDLNIYKQILVETHPGLFRYLTELEFYQIMEDIQSQIEKPLQFYEFYRLLAGLTAEIRCAHTTLFPKKDVLNYIMESCNLFPFFVYPVDDKIYVLFNGTEDTRIKPGYELISINKKEIPEIKKIIKRYAFRDGYGNSVLRRFLRGGYFSMYYYFFIEQPPQFNIVFKDLDGDIIQYQIAGQPYKITEKNYVANPVNSEMMSFYNKKNKNWGFQFLDELPSTALLHLYSFGGKGINNEEKAQKAIQDFLNKAMKKIERKNVTNLIVDLRSNNGGWDVQGKELFSYLMKSDIATDYYRDQFAVTQDSEFLKYSDLSPEDLERAETFLIPQEDGTFKLDPEGNITLKPQEPKKKRFNGNLYILVDEQCASACAEFVAVAKSNEIGILVGNDSGGAYEGGNGSTFINYQLPNSGISSNTPLVKYEMAVKPAAEIGMGTIPDYTILPNLEDILSGRDAQKEFVYQLIRERN